MAIPFRRTSKTKKALRRTHFKLDHPNLVACSNCGQTIQQHRICPHCGFYDKKQVVQVGAEAQAAKPAPKTKEKPKAKKEEKKEVKKEAKKETK